MGLCASYRKTEYIVVDYWWLVRVTLVVDWQFLPQILDRWWGPMKAICCSVNVDGVGMVLAGAGDTSTLYVITEVV